MDIKEFKKEFDVLFVEKLRSLISEAKGISKYPYTNNSIDHIYKIATEGKRLRPYNTALSYFVYSGKDWRDIVNILIGVELIHIMALVHDDVMDDAVSRHGVSTIQDFVKNDIAEFSNDENISKSQAVLVGDLIFSWAYRSFAIDIKSAEQWKVVNTLVEEVVIGQMIDILSPMQDRVAMDTVLDKMLLKTARYTFTRPLLLGAVSAGSSADDSEWILSFGDSMGMLFQAQDDLLDVVGDVSVIKKNPLGDIKNGVHTIMSVYVKENCSAEDIARWDNFKKSENIIQSDVVEFLNEIGALDDIKKYIDKKYQESMDAISCSGLNEKNKKFFVEILETLNNRKY
jgi:geranylgeranyl diphosphate synthase type I